MRTETITRDIYEPGDILDAGKARDRIPGLGFVLVLDANPDNSEYLILTDKNQTHPIYARSLEGAHHMKKIDLSEWNALVKKAKTEENKNA